MPACVLAVRARCARLLPCLPTPTPACVPAPVPVLATLAPCAWPACSRCSRLYCSFSRRALARCSARCARRKLFRDRLRGVDIYPAVVRGGGWHDFILLYGLIWGRGDSAAISWYAAGLKKSFEKGLTSGRRLWYLMSVPRTRAQGTDTSKASTTYRRANASHRRTQLDKCIGG